MGWILSLAAAVRLPVALIFPNIIAPDEVFQYLEPAHQLVFGQGIVPWEFQVGLRSWLIPLIMAGPMELAHLVFVNPLAGLVLIRFLLVLASLPIVWVAAKWGERIYGREGLWTAGIFTALWPDLWLMAPHPLEEVLAADVLVPALYLVEKFRVQASMRQISLAGFMLGAALALRLQLAPAVAFAGIMMCGRDMRRWQAGMAWGTVPLLLVGGLDWISWGQPFRSFWLNIYLNLFLGVAKREFGSEPFGYFLNFMIIDWLWTLPVMCLLCWRAASRLPVAGFSIVIIFVVHSLLAHKEYRFLFPAIALSVPLAGVGLAELVANARHGAKLNLSKIFMGGVLLAGPLCGPWTYFMLNLHTGSFELFEDIARLHPHFVDVQVLERRFTDSGSIFLPLDLLLGPNIHLVRKSTFTTPSGPVMADAIIKPVGTAPIEPGFSKQACFGGGWVPFARVASQGICVWMRKGGDTNKGNAPPFIWPFPPEAEPFIVRDRLTD